MENDLKKLLVLDLRSNFNSELKTPRFYETWTWQGDLTVLPDKWMSLIKSSSLEIDRNYLKENYYSNPKFDQKSFFFLTHRSETAGCVYLNRYRSDTDTEADEYHIEFFLVNNKKHLGKGVEEGLLSLCIKRAFEIENLGTLNRIFLDTSTSNIEVSKLKTLGFIYYNE